MTETTRERSSPAAAAERLLGTVGARVLGSAAPAGRAAGALGAVVIMTARAAWAGLVVSWTGRLRPRKQLWPMLSNVGVRSFPIVCLISVLIGAILVLQIGDVMRNYGQLGEVPGVVALSMTRELGPIMTAIILIARVGASYTAVLGSMKINDEILALRTMAIDPVGYLVAPRFVAMLVMTPLLTLFSYVLGIIGGALVGQLVYGIPTASYIAKTIAYLSMVDVTSGLVKATVFGVLISGVSCWFGFVTTGGSTGLGRFIMVSVVTTLVVVVLADTVLTALFVNYYL